jgi:hypothetical protein
MFLIPKVPSCSIEKCFESPNSWEDGLYGAQAASSSQTNSLKKMCEDFVFGGPFGLPKGLRGWLAHHLGGFFHQIKVSHPLERKISIQTVLPRIRQQELFVLSENSKGSAKK